MKRIVLSSVPVLLLAAPPAWAVNWLEVNLTCENADKFDTCKPLTDPQRAELKTFCALDATLPDEGTAHPEKWLQSSVPSSDLVSMAANCFGAATLAGPNAAASAFLGINQSALLWGATDFLVERGREELQVWFYDQFVKDICEKATDGGPVGKDLFPNTCAVLKDTSTSLYLGGMPELQAAVRKDLVHLPTAALLRGIAAATNKTDKDAARATLYLSLFIENLINGKGFAEALGGVHTSTSAGWTPPDCSDGLAASLVYDIALALAAVPKKDGSVGQVPDDNKERTRLIMAVAVNMKAAAAQPVGCSTTPNGVSFDPVLLAAGLKAASRVVFDLRGAIKEFSEALKGASLEVRLAAFARIGDVGLQGALDVLSISQLAGKPGIAGATKIITAVKPVVHNLAAGRFGEVALGLGAFFASIIFPNRPPELDRLVGFAVDAAQARDPDAAREVIARFSAPQGSYKRKREGGWYFGVNAYVGGGFSFEVGKQQSDNWSDAKLGYSFAPFVPIGLEVGKSLGKTSLGLFVQVLDLGAPASWRITAKDDQLKDRPEIGVAQVFSPGAFIVLGIPGAPLSLGAGASWAPRLRSLSSGTSDADQRDAIRVSAMFAVDIPIFP